MENMYAFHIENANINDNHHTTSAFYVWMLCRIRFLTQNFELHTVAHAYILVFSCMYSKEKRTDGL